jgi:hypothetical protein
MVSKAAMALVAGAAGLAMKTALEKGLEAKARALSSDPGRWDEIKLRLRDATLEGLTSLSADLDAIERGEALRSRAWPDRDRLDSVDMAGLELSLTIKARLIATLIPQASAQNPGRGASMRADVATLAALAREPEVLQKMLEGGAKPWDELAFGGGCGLALAACWSGSDGCLELLMAAGAPWGGKAGGVDALGWAAGSSSKAVARLLKARANPLAVDAWGLTALMRAARAGQKEAVELLMESSDVLALDHAGRSAADWAQASGHGALAELLRRPLEDAERLALRAREGREGASLWRQGAARALPRRP